MTKLLDRIKKILKEGAALKLPTEPAQSPKKYYSTNSRSTPTASNNNSTAKEISKEVNKPTSSAISSGALRLGARVGTLATGLLDPSFYGTNAFGKNPSSNDDEMKNSDGSYKTGLTPKTPQEKLDNWRKFRDKQNSPQGKTGSIEFKDDKPKISEPEVKPQSSPAPTPLPVAASSAAASSVGKTEVPSSQSKPAPVPQSKPENKKKDEDGENKKREKLSINIPDSPTSSSSGRVGSSNAKTTVNQAKERIRYEEFSILEAVKKAAKEKRKDQEEKQTGKNPFIEINPELKNADPDNEIGNN